MPADASSREQFDRCGPGFESRVDGEARRLGAAPGAGSGARARIKDEKEMLENVMPMSTKPIKF